MKKIFTFLIILLALGACKQEKKLEKKQYAVAISGVYVALNDGEIIQEENETETEEFIAKDDDEAQDRAYVKYVLKLRKFAIDINRKASYTFVPIAYKIIDNYGNIIEMEIDKIGPGGTAIENFREDDKIPENYIQYLGLDYYNLTPYGQRHPYEYTED